MRLISIFSSLLLSLILAGSVTAAAQQSRFENRPVALKDENNATCTIEKLVQNGQGNIENDTSALNPERISILNWNIYKGKRENWAIDFKRYSYKHDVLMIQEAHMGDD